MKKLLILCAALTLAGCGTTKTSNYIFNQGLPNGAPQQAAVGMSEVPSDRWGAGGGSTNSGGAGNTIIIIESTNQDAKSDQDFSGVLDALEKLKMDLPLVGENVVPPPVEEEIAVPEVPEDKPVVEEVE